MLVFACLHVLLKYTVIYFLKSSQNYVLLNGSLIRDTGHHKAPWKASNLGWDEYIIYRFVHNRQNAAIQIQ